MPCHPLSAPTPRMHSLGRIAVAAAALAIVALQATPVHAQYDEPLVTDRPDFTEASSTVGRGVVQLETGYTFTYDDSDADGTTLNSHTAPELLFRIGVNDAVELRIGWTYQWDRIDTGGTDLSLNGANDLYLGAKFELAEQCCWKPEQAVIVQGTAPTGSDDFTTGETEFGINYLYSWELCNEWSLGASTGADSDTDGEDNFTVWHQSVALGIPLNDCLGTYVEYFGLYTQDRGPDIDQHFLNGGFSYLLNYNVLLDFRVGLGLNDDSEDFFTGVGGSFRF